MQLIGLLLLLLAAASALPASDPLASFGAAHVNQTVANATLAAFAGVADAAACAAACLALPESPRCIGFAVAPSPGGGGGSGGPLLDCLALGWSQTYAVVANATGAAYFSRLIERDDRPVVPALAYALETPTAGVTLGAGSLFARFHALNRIYLSQFPVDDMLFWFRVRSGDPNPPGQSYGWDNAGFEGGYGLKGSVAGAFMMGAGGHVRWANDSALWAALAAVVDGVAVAQQADGFAMAFNQEDTHCRENPDYVTSWMTHGLLEAAAAGLPQALSILRRHYDYFDYAQDELAQFLPPLGGANVTGLPWPGGEPPDAYGGPPCKRDLQTNQGMVHNTRMALSPVGTMRDAAVVADIYAEAWWIEALAERDEQAIWMRHFYPHNYEITAWEAFADLGVITGDPKYLAAVDGAWDMLRASWLHVGGSVAINEAQLYPPGSYFLEPPNPDWRHPTPLPTGELCGSSFWVKLNQRLLRLRPAGEPYAAEIERSLINVVLAAISGDGLGIRYFARLHQHKDGASNVSTCCEGQGTRELGALPEYIFSSSARGVHVHLYQAATIAVAWAGAQLEVQVQTEWPYGEDVAIGVRVAAGGSPPPAAPISMLLRVPAWLATPQANVSVEDASGGKTFAAGERGSYLEVVLAPAALPATLRFALPMAFRSTLYTGFDQIGNSSRYAVELGPVLLAATGALTPIGADAAIALPAALNPSRPGDWLVAGDVPLHFSVQGVPDVAFVPYFEVQDEAFDVFPIFGGGFVPTACALEFLQAYVSPPVARAGRASNVTAELQDSPAGCADLAGLTGALALPAGVSLPQPGEPPAAARRADGVLTLTWSGVLAAAALAGAPASFSASAPGAVPVSNAAFAVSWLSALEGPAPPQERYAPAPSPPDTGAVVGVMMVCGLWRGREAWEPLLPFRDREPALSFCEPLKNVAAFLHARVRVCVRAHTSLSNHALRRSLLATSCLRNLRRRRRRCSRCRLGALLGT